MSALLNTNREIEKLIVNEDKSEMNNLFHLNLAIRRKSDDITFIFYEQFDFYVTLKFNSKEHFQILRNLILNICIYHC